MPHISICVVTYRRCSMLQELLRYLQNQETLGTYTYEIIIIDNDAQQTAKSVVSQAAKTVKITYYCQPRKNIALARNCALSLAQGEYIAFIDDDDIPTDRWLYTLLQAIIFYQADVAHGACFPRYDDAVPAWIKKSCFFLPKLVKTGVRMYETRSTNNCLLRRDFLCRFSLVFDSAFGLTGGEDRMFFQECIKRKARFVWCHEAYVYERITRARASLRWMIARAIREGSTDMRILSNTFGRTYAWRRCYSLGWRFVSTALARIVKSLYWIYKKQYQNITLLWRRWFMDAGEVFGFFGGKWYEYR